MEVIEPLVPIEATEDVDSFRANQRCAVPLTPGWRVGGLCGPRRPDPLALSRVKDVQLVGSSLPIVPTEEENLVANEVCCVAPEPRGWCAEDLGLRPLQLLCVENVQVGEVLVAAMPTEKVELCADDGHRVRVTRLRQCPRERWLHPRHGLQVDDVHVVEALGAIVAAEHVELVGKPCEGVAGAGRRWCAGGRRLVPGEPLCMPCSTASRWGSCVKNVHVRHPLVAVVTSMHH
mmetsp:Transcript_6100/g.18084  ORF Transcript_6100/g.18084 Transcript_6100/m.18084 type:complete len:233 (+) Transcript_6100:772-1470(+)